MKLNLDTFDNPLCLYCDDVITKYRTNYFYLCEVCKQSATYINNNDNYYCYICDKPCTNKSTKVDSELYSCNNCLSNKYYIAYECSEYYDIRRVHIKDNVSQLPNQILFFLDIFPNQNKTMLLSYKNNITKMVESFNCIYNLAPTIKNKQSISSKFEKYLPFL